MAGDFNVAIVIRAIDGLTAPVKRMNDSMKSMMAPIHKLNASGQRFGKALGIGDVATASREVGANFRTATREVGLLGAKVAALGAAGMWLFKTQFIDTAAQFERFGLVLETVEGSSDKAKAALDWVANFAKTTPYELEEVMGAFVQLRTRGIDPTRGLLRTLGDTAAALGVPIEDAVSAATSAVVGEYERLKAFGVTAQVKGDKLRLLYTDKSGKEQSKIVAKNSRAQIQSTLEAIWSDKFAGAMDKQSRSWTGMVSNLADTWTQFKLQVMNAGLFDWLRERIGGLLATLNQMAASGKLQEYAQRVARAIQGVFDYVWSRRQDIVDTFLAIRDAIVWVVGAVGGLRNAVILMALAMSANAIKSVVELGFSIGKLGQTAGWTAMKLGGLIGSKLGLAKAIPAVIAWGSAWFGAAAGVIAATWPILAIIAAIAAVVAAVYFAIKYWDKLVAVWERFKNASLATKIVIAALLAPLTAIIAPIMGIAWLARKIIDNWEPIKEFFAGIWDSIVSGVQTAIEWLKKIELPEPLRKFLDWNMRIAGMGFDAIGAAAGAVADVGREVGYVAAGGEAGSFDLATSDFLGRTNAGAERMSGVLKIEIDSKGKAHVVNAESDGLDLDIYSGYYGFGGM